ncbi:MAG TPA: GGDEF domain-containing protein [Pseudonocardiaceae bacterium]|nr:GGDEF domain-containing protein [Pseudonocardiaceae bacterium]
MPRCPTCDQPLGYFARDRLTGVLDRWGWDETAPRAFSNAIRRNQPIALLVVDVDRFKDINDSRGHAAGDTVLQAIATELDNGTRHADIVCRYGGDEFALLLPAADLPGALAVARQLHQRIGALVVPVRAPRDASMAMLDGHSISIGLAAHLPGQPGAPTLDGLMLDADAALLVAKQRGRGRTYAAMHRPGPDGANGLDGSDSAGLAEPDIIADSAPTGLR